jgi:integrase
VTAVFSDPTKDTAHHSARAYPEVASWLGRRELEEKAARTRDGDERYTAWLLRENLDLALGEYTPQVIESFLLKVPPKSRRKYRAHLAKLFEWAEAEELIPIDPMRRVAKFPRPKQKIVSVYSDAEIDALQSLPDPDGPLYQILFDAAIRSSEARALQVKHVNFEREVIAIFKGKGAKDRLIPMIPRLTVRLSEWFLLDGLGREDYLWYMRRGGHDINRDRMLGPTSIKMWHGRCEEAAGVKHRKLHSTRHTAATRALRKGVSIVTVSKTLGHASMKTTADEYAHLAVEDMAAELALLEL